MLSLGACPVSLPLPVRSFSLPTHPKPWQLPTQGLAVFHGEGEATRLSHYFLPRILAAGKQILYLDGANRIDPLLIARLARQRGQQPSEFNRRIQVARAFTCFQLTELLARVPRALQEFPANVLVVTALPDLYFDEDVREAEARISFEQALRKLRRLARQPLSVAVFSDATTFATPRRRFFDQLTACADQVWRFEMRADSKPQLICERPKRRLPH